MKKIDLHGHLGVWHFPIPNAGTPDSLLRLCRKYDIEFVVCSSIDAIVYDMTGGNAHIVEALGPHDSLLTYVFCNPNFVDESCGEMDRYLGQPGVVGVKIHPQYSRVPISDPRMAELFAQVADRASLLLIHTFSAADALALIPLAQAHPGLNIVMAHACGVASNVAADAASQCPNLHLDFCCSWANAGKVEYAVGKCGPEQIVFGSDMDLIDPAFVIGTFEGAGLSDGEKRLIYRENAERLLGF